MCFASTRLSVRFRFPPKKKKMQVIIEYKLANKKITLEGKIKKEYKIGNREKARKMMEIVTKSNVTVKVEQTAPYIISITKKRF